MDSEYVLSSIASLDNSLPSFYAKFPARLRLTTRAPSGIESEFRTCHFLKGDVMQTNEPKLWEELYAAAVLESDPAKIQERINLAQSALRDRWQTLGRIPLPHDHERQRIEDAMRTLDLIRNTELRAPRVIDRR
jgi:hypothetical protein